MDRWECDARHAVWRVIGLMSCLFGISVGMIAGDQSVLLPAMSIALLIFGVVLNLLGHDSQPKIPPLARTFIPDLAMTNRIDQARITEKIKSIFLQSSKIAITLSIMIFMACWLYNAMGR